MQLVRESLYDDLYYYNIINESVLNEEFNFDKIKNAIFKIKNKSVALNNLIKKFNETKNINVRKHLSTILIMLFLANFTGRNSIFGDISRMSKEVAKEQTINKEILHNIAKETLQELEIKNMDIKTAKASENIKNQIKEHEKLNLTAYSIGDGHITIGYGHAYPEKISPYKIGDKITIEKANELFNQDIIKVENGIKRMFKEWEEKNIKIKIDQHMFDAMISMSYNMGINAFRKTQFVKLLKEKRYNEAAEKIKTTYTKSKIYKDKKPIFIEMPGLITRRQKEYELFSKNL